MKRWLALFILILVFISSRFGSHESTAPSALMKKAAPVQKPSVLTPPQAPPAKTVASPQVSTNRQPAAVKIQVSFGEQPIRIGKSFGLVENIRTIPKHKYLPSMGPNLTEINGFVYFRPASAEINGWPVAQDKSSERLFPVSHILHVKGVDAELREQLKSQGMNEFYYHSRLKLISLEATPETVVKQFQQLTARGYDARLEVLKDLPRSK